MIEITSPDALGVQRINVDGTERYTIQPLRMGEAGRTRYGQDDEYAVRSTSGCGQWFYLDPAEALGKAMEETGKYWM